MFQPVLLALALTSTVNPCPPDQKEIILGHHPRHSVCAALDTGSLSFQCPLKTLAKDGINLSINLSIAYVSPTHAEAQARGPNFPSAGHIESFDGKQGDTHYIFGSVPASSTLVQTGAFEVDLHDYNDLTPRFHASFKGGTVIVYDQKVEIGRGACESHFIL